MPMRVKFDVRATSEPPPPEPLPRDTKYAIISGVLAGFAALLLIAYVIRATCKRRQRLKHYRSDLNISQRANLDGSNDGLLSRGRPLPTNYRNSYYNPSTTDSDSYNEFSNLPRPRSQTEPILPLVNSTTRPLAITRRAEHTPSPEYRSIQNTPKCLPKLVIPSATSKPRSSKGVTATASGLETPDTSPSVYSQTSAGHALGSDHIARDRSTPPPVPPIPAQYEGAARLGRADTRAIASLLKSLS